MQHEYLLAIGGILRSVPPRLFLSFASAPSRTFPVNNRITTYKLPQSRISKYEYYKKITGL